MRFSCLCLSLGVLLAPARSFGQDNPETPPEARAAFEQAQSAYERELFTEAEDAFRRAYELFPATDPRRALLLLNIAVVIERQTGRDGEALEVWERFRREAAGVAEAELLVRATIGSARCAARAASSRRSKRARAASCRSEATAPAA